MISTTQIDYEKQDEKFKNDICSLYVNLKRENINFVADKLETLLSEFKTLDIHSDNQRCYLFIITIKIIIYCRDISFGKGERKMSYAMLYILHKYYPSLALHIIQNLPLNEYSNNQFHITDKNSVGCWRDIPEMCKYIRTCSPLRDDHPLIQQLVHFMNKQLANDLLVCKNNVGLPNNEKQPYSLVAKWIPRERTKTNWLFSKFALDWVTTNYPYKISSATNYINYTKAVNKCKMNYRHIISSLNAELNTVEILQCANQWEQISPEKVNLHSFKKYNHSFFNKYNLHENREKCKKNMYDYFTDFLETKNESTKLRSAVKCDAGGILRNNDIPLSCPFNSLPIHTFVKRAILLIDERNDLDDDLKYIDKILYIQKKKLLELQINILNKEWEQLSSDIHPDNCIPVICMDYCENYSNLGIACLYAKKTKRVIIVGNNNSEDLLFSNFIERALVDISDLKTFIDIIERLRKYCDVSIVNCSNAIDDCKRELDMIVFSTFFVQQFTPSASEKPAQNKVVFISNIDLYDDIKNRIQNSNSLVYSNFSFIFHYVGNREINIIDDNNNNELLVVSGDSKSTVKHISNYFFNTNFNMISHCLNLYSSAFTDTLGWHPNATNINNNG